jgi:hypothetical protein
MVAGRGMAATVRSIKAGSLLASLGFSTTGGDSHAAKKNARTKVKNLFIRVQGVEGTYYANRHERKQIKKPPNRSWRLLGFGVYHTPSRQLLR